MAQFDCYQTDGSGLLLDIQADLLDGLTTRVVVPLLPISVFPTQAHRLNPVFDINEERLVMVTEFIGAVPLVELKRRVGTLEPHRGEIIRALDTLLSGV